jgi:histidinol dehydrogenase
MTHPALELIRSDAADFAERFERVEQRQALARDEVDRAVAAILADVRERGDDALLDAIERFDGYRLTRDELRVGQAEIEGAGAQLTPEHRDALALAADRVRSFHASHPPASWRLERKGEELGQEIRPIARVGVYVPGFQAPLASSVLMICIPAAVAGVRDLVITSPARRHHPAILEAARLAGVTRVFRVGGAQAIGALAYGTGTVPSVDKIVGPGSVWTQSAKRQVFGQVAIDADAGPSEVLILADESADADFIAADLLAQAEHDEAASVVLATPSEVLARRVIEQLERRLARVSRREVASVALRERSLAVVTRDLDEAVELANRYAAEHLQIMTREPRELVPRIEHAGAIFLGAHAPVPLGDYVAGPSHVLPTGRTARFFSPLGVEDFVKRMSVIGVEPDVFARIGPHARRLAELEGLEAHAQSIGVRLDRLRD